MNELLLCILLMVHNHAISVSFFCSLISELNLLQQHHTNSTHSMYISLFLVLVAYSFLFSCAADNLKTRGKLKMPIREAHRVVKIYGVFESSRKVESTFDYIYKIRKLRISRFVAHSTFYQQQIVQLQKKI
jgi:hypothetical protein